MALAPAWRPLPGLGQAESEQSQPLPPRAGRTAGGTPPRCAVACWLPYRTGTENLAEPFPAGPSQLTVTCRVPVSGKSIVPRYRPGALPGDSVAPATIGAMPGMAMLALSVTLPTSSGCPEGDVNSSTNVFLPGFHCPVSLLSVTTASLVFCVCMTLSSALQAVEATPTAKSPPTTVITAIRRFINRSSLCMFVG